MLCLVLLETNTRIRNYLTLCVQSITEVSRIFMKENPRQKLPIDYVKYPGKMDHASVICLTVGKNNGDN